MYIPFRREITIQSACECSTKYTREITCIDLDGTLACIHDYCIDSAMNFRICLYGILLL